MNDWLNDKVVNTNPQNPDPKVRGRVQVQYKHRRELDRFYELPSSLQGRLPGCVRARIPPKHGVKVRVTYDQKTGNVLQKIVKARVADHHLHMPGCPLDCRISVNLEAAWDGPVEELEQAAISHETRFPDRNKDRLSYTQSHYQIDLTQVTQSFSGPNVRSPSPLDVFFLCLLPSHPPPLFPLQSLSISLSLLCLAPTKYKKDTLLTLMLPCRTRHAPKRSTSSRSSWRLTR